jgi:hypothetical protein
MRIIFLLLTVVTLSLSLNACKNRGDKDASDVKSTIIDPPNTVAGEEQRCMCIGEWYCKDNPNVNGTAEAKDLPSEASCKEELVREARVSNDESSPCSTESYTVSDESFSVECVAIKSAP